ncbi:uncharacterized protein MKZ38_010141 [Zalerion maritima]|uniref:Uncharacterized protein n=1 Tax=Zalerion maritima TaxID=339359 RepID=A0AAD5RG46_9PEZI|nr:uncharacterized protein MKZ38_010141 [Zalerion maritima]
MQSRRSEDGGGRSISQRPPSPNTSRKPIAAQPTVPRNDAPQPSPSKPVITQGPSASASQQQSQVGDDNTNSNNNKTAAPQPQPESPQAPPVPIETKPPAKSIGKPIIMPQPLITDDISLYTNPNLEVEAEGTTLEELAHLVRLSKYQERKRASTRIRLQRTLISTALFARLTRCGEAVHHHLYEAFRSQDKQSFAGLYNAFIDVRNSCEATRRYALLEPEMEALTSSSSDTLDATPIGGAIGGSSVTPFLNDISASAREAFLGFLTSLRTNPDYLATRLCSLSSAELATFVNFNQAAEPESVLPGGGATPRGGRTGSLRRSGNPLNSSNRNSTHMPSPVEKLLSFQRHDPLATLLHSCFANSAGPESVEDRRRTDVWATAIARLVTSANHNGMNPNSSPDHQIMASTLSAWASMRDWTGRSKMEWYLMKVLEEGAFILQRAEDPNGTMFMVSTWTTEDQRKQDEFYNRAVEELFEILDDEDATGIPEGAVELGQQILRKLDGRFMDHTRQWFVYQWLFADWLFRVMASPESFGMMVNYNITPYGRDKILKTIHGKAQSLVTNMLPTWEKGHATAPKDSPPHKIVGHIESILSRFKPSRSRKLTTRLLPARSVTSLRETTEVRPYLIISPADLATMVNALFPEPRPRSSHSSSIRSGAPSVSSFSAISQPMSVITNRSQFDTQSIVSTSYSSTMSDTTTSQETIDEQLFQRHSPDSINQNRMSNYEDDGYRLRFALHEMNQILGSDVVRGSCHPCAERWAVIFLSPDGRSLSTQMSFDPDDEADDEENSSTTSDSDGELEERPELDKDYHQLRDSILKLVEEYEIPQGLDKDANKFSNRPSGLKKYKSKNKIITPESSMQSKNPYRQMAKVEEDEEPPNVLIAMLQAASSQSKAQSEFVSAHLYWKTLQQLSALTSPSLRKDGFATLLNIFSRGPRDSIRRSAAAIEEYDAWLVWLKQSQERHEGLIESMMGRLRGLRDMTWYVTDVRHSKPYAESMSVCKALRTMGNPRLWDNFRRTRVTNDRGVSARYLLSTNNQVIDMIAAPEDQGGPNKLTDEHAEIAFKWLQHQEIENFCRGEERIHRLCYEVDSCISKLLGSTVLDGPVLWSSELFAKDKKMLENAGKDKGVSWTGSSLADDTSSIISDSFERRNTFSTSSRPSSLAGNLRNMSLSNTSQQSFESGRFSFPRAAPTVALSEATDSHEYFGVGSPVRTIDSASTFFSPFQSHSGQSVTASRAHSPTTSITNLSNTLNNAYSPAPLSSGRPGTSASSNETVSVQKNSEEKQRFLDDLRQSLTSLLISDLGSLVFALGSETDAWFGKLGQEMIDRKETQSKYRRRLAAKKEKAKDKVAKSMMKPRVIEKKKSIGDLRGAHDEIGSEASDNTATLGHDSSATSDTMRSARSRKRDSPEFPFVKAYQRLLSMFCVHPNPHAKLQALFDLEHLIVASLASGSKRSRLALGRADLANSTINENEATGRQKPLEDAIDNVRERRSQTFLSPLSSPVMPGQPRTINTETRSVMSVIGPTNTDAIANVLQSLFRDANIRPKTLFRDLQYIASFVPPSILDKTEKGKAFWDTALAALALKQEVCCSMVEVADEVNKGHLEVRKNTRPGAGSAAGSDAGSSASGYMGIDTTSAALPSPSLPKYTARNAAEMLTIAAKERNATAQRELAFSYLMQAELLDRATLPLSRPRDVFKQALIEQYGPARQHHGPRGEGGMIDVKQDPALICLAFHWAGQADSGGDELAGQFIRQHLEADKSSKM